MAWYQDFITDGLFHWRMNGEAPCGAVPYPELGKGTTLFGWRPPTFVFPEPCPICTPTKEKYFKLLRNGGSMSGWDIRPNEDRDEVDAGRQATQGSASVGNPEDRR